MRLEGDQGHLGADLPNHFLVASISHQIGKAWAQNFFCLVKRLAGGIGNGHLFHSVTVCEGFQVELEMRSSRLGDDSYFD